MGGSPYVPWGGPPYVRLHAFRILSVMGGPPLWATRSLQERVSYRGGGSPPYGRREEGNGRIICTDKQRYSSIICIDLGTNGVAMAPHGLILSQDEDTSLGKVFKFLLGLQDTMLN